MKCDEIMISSHERNWLEILYFYFLVPPKCVEENCNSLQSAIVSTELHKDRKGMGLLSSFFFTLIY